MNDQKKKKKIEKYAEKKNKSRIKECFQSIPKQLSKENKKFQYSVVKKGSTASKYEGSLQWPLDGGHEALRREGKPTGKIGHAEDA